MLGDIKEYVSKSSNPEILKNCLVSLKFLSDTNDERQIQELIDHEFHKDLFRFLDNLDSELASLSLKIIDNLIAVSDDQTQELINSGLIGVIAPFLHHKDRQIMKKVCLIYSNILAGNSKQIRLVFAFEEGAIVKELIQKVIEESQEVKSLSSSL